MISDIINKYINEDKEGKAYGEGYEAGFKKKPNRNPYHGGKRDREFNAWEQGFADGEVYREQGGY